MSDTLPTDTVIRPRVFARERLATPPAPPAPKPFVVWLRGQPQSAHANAGEANAAAERLAIAHAGDPVQVLQLVETFRTKLVVERVRP